MPSHLIILLVLIPVGLIFYTMFFVKPERRKYWGGAALVAIAAIALYAGMMAR